MITLQRILAKSAILFVLPLFLFTLPAYAQTLLLSSTRAGDAVVSGVVDPNSGPVKILDMSFAVPTPIGESSSVDSNGNFAVAISPPALEGHSLLAEDANGNQSAPVIVAPQPPELLYPDDQ